jgi:hypothetical protein
MPRYLLLLRDNSQFPTDLSPQEMQAIIGRYMQWGNRLREQGLLRGSDKLRDSEGRVMRRNGDKLSVTDGPFAEAKEIVGGFYIIEAASYDEALRQCNDHPHLDWGSIELREVEHMG